MGVGARDLQQSVGGDVEDSSGPTSVGLVAGTAVPCLGPLLVFLMHAIPKNRKFSTGTYQVKY
jgi:hypothetical protein